ncbi:MAG: hypothetical protein L3J23_02380 [Flavobacteriaceae bacterium]|nr:hypothetical protein [Flavobacteriaceae bacterium]
MNYKNKFLFLAIILIIFFSCKNDISILETTETPTESDAIKIALTVLKTHFNTDGSLNNEENLVGNIIFDFGFEFIYPNTLSYNNGTEVVIENFQSLVTVMVAMTDSLFVNGITFPFNIKTFVNGGIQIKTINDESEFIQLLENRRITENNDCVCTEIFNPVCVEIQDLNGGNFTLEFPNICYAICEGFTEKAVVSCNSAINTNFALCFEFIYPFSIIDTDSNTIVINTTSDFENAVFLNYTFDFIYPFNIDTNNNQEETITSIEALENLLRNCFSANCLDNCPTSGPAVCTEFENNGQILTFVYQNTCFATCDGFTEVDYIDCANTIDCFDNCSNDYYPVCVEVTLPNGLTVIYQYYNACYAACEGFISQNFINCI